MTCLGSHSLEMAGFKHHWSAPKAALLPPGHAGPLAAAACGAQQALGTEGMCVAGCGPMVLQSSGFEWGGRADAPGTHKAFN